MDTMDLHELAKATQALIKFLDEHDVYDEFFPGGERGFEAERSIEFQDLINETKEVLQRSIRPNEK